MSAFTLHWLLLNCMEILANQLKRIKKAKSVFNDFDFQSDELLSSTHNDTVFGAISNSSVRFTFLIPQESVDHAVLEADKHEPVFCNALSFEHLMIYLHMHQTRNIWKTFIKLQQMVSKNGQ